LTPGNAVPSDVACAGSQVWITDAAGHLYHRETLDYVVETSDFTLVDDTTSWFSVSVTESGHVFAMRDEHFCV